MPRKTKLGVGVNSRHSLSLSFPVCRVDTEDPCDAFDWAGTQDAGAPLGEDVGAPEGLCQARL